MWLILLLTLQAVKYQIDFQLGSGSFTIVKDRRKTNKKMELSFKTLCASYLVRPSSMKASVSLNDLTLIDGITENTVHPVVIRAKNQKSSISSESMEATGEQPSTVEMVENSAFFQLVYENKPLSGNADNAVELSMRPLEIIYVKETIDQVVQFFEPPQRDVSFETLKAVAESTFEAGIKGISRYSIIAKVLPDFFRAGLQFALEEHKTLDLKVDVEAPIFVFPEK